MQSDPELIDAMARSSERLQDGESCVRGCTDLSDRPIKSVTLPLHTTKYGCKRLFLANAEPRLGHICSSSSTPLPVPAILRSPAIKSIWR